jgi:hypothetical protein
LHAKQRCIAPHGNQGGVARCACERILHAVTALRKLLIHPISLDGVAGLVIVVHTCRRPTHEKQLIGHSNRPPTGLQQGALDGPTVQPKPDLVKKTIELSHRCCGLIIKP